MRTFTNSAYHGCTSCANSLDLSGVWMAVMGSVWYMEQKAITFSSTFEETLLSGMGSGSAPSSSSSSSASASVSLTSADMKATLRGTCARMGMRNYYLVVVSGFL